MSDTYEINEHEEVVPYTSGRMNLDTNTWRDATELELQQRDAIAELESQLTTLQSAHDKLKERVEGAPRTTFELGTKIDINNHYTYFKGSKTVALVELGQDDSCDTSGE